MMTYTDALQALNARRVIREARRMSLEKMTRHDLVRHYERSVLGSGGHLPYAYHARVGKPKLIQMILDREIPIFTLERLVFAYEQQALTE